MSVTETDLHHIQAYIAPLLGQKAWGVSLGFGSFITLEFGKSLSLKEDYNHPHGEWHLWVYCCAWRLEHGNQILAASEDPRDELELAVRQLEGLTLDSIDLFPPAWDAVFRFEKQVALRLFSIYSQEVTHWMLYTPNEYVLSFGPSSSWSYEKSSTASP